MPRWPTLPVKRPRAPGPGANAVIASASTPQERIDTITARLASLTDYVIFANHARMGEYVQFATTREGLLMEVASGAFGGDGRRLKDDDLAVTTLGSLGLHLEQGGNFQATDVSAAPEQVAVWVEGIFLNLFRAEETFTMDVLGDPGRS